MRSTMRPEGKLISTGPSPKRSWTSPQNSWPRRPPSKKQRFWAARFSRRFEMQIKFQTALITGSSRGLGRQIAVKLAMEGLKKIAIHYRTSKSDAETTLSLIQAQGASGCLAQGDVADAMVAENLVKEAAEKLGGCDIFVQSVCPPLGEIYERVMSTELL